MEIGETVGRDPSIHTRLYDLAEGVPAVWNKLCRAHEKDPAGTERMLAIARNAGVTDMRQVRDWVLRQPTSKKHEEHKDNAVLYVAGSAYFGSFLGLTVDAAALVCDGLAQIAAGQTDVHARLDPSSLINVAAGVAVASAGFGYYLWRQTGKFYDGHMAARERARKKVLEGDCSREDRSMILEREK